MQTIEMVLVVVREVEWVWKGRNHNGKSRDQKVRTHTLPMRCTERKRVLRRLVSRRRQRRRGNRVSMRPHRMSAYDSAVCASICRRPDQLIDNRSGEDHQRRLRRRRTGCEFHKTEFVALTLLVPFVNHCAGSVCRSDGSDNCAVTGCDRATESGTPAATRSADRIVSPCAGCADPRSRYLSRPDRGSGPVVAATYRSQGRTIRPGSG